MSTRLTREPILTRQQVVTYGTKEDEPSGSSSSLTSGLGLGVATDNKKRFFWQRKAAYDPDAVATQPSVFDDRETAEKYKPRPDW